MSDSRHGGFGPLARPALPSAIDLAKPLRRQWQVLKALVMLEIQNRFGRLGFASVFALLEPLMNVFMIYFFMDLMNRKPTHGTSLLFLVVSGILPLFMFIHVSVRVRGATTGTRNSARFPAETMLDAVLAHGIVQGMVNCTLLVGMLVGMALWGIREATPHSPTTAVAAILILFVFAIGAGLINATITTFLSFWQYMYSAVARITVLMSGVFLAPDTMPPQFRDVVAWNPIVHAIEWFRTAFYPIYPAIILDFGYLFTSVLGTLVVGLAITRVLRRRLDT